ncbi:hypothetical protein F4604DRAFT_1989536 [Suillus subluteus]|nr:hypothetical protein F4604DRAFT_1989536 [Suillus subluteus]
MLKAPHAAPKHLSSSKRLRYTCPFRLLVPPAPIISAPLAQYLQLPNISTKSKAAQLIATALAAVYNNHIPVMHFEGWDDNDYTFMRSVAQEIDMGRFDIETLKWKAAGTLEDGSHLGTNYTQRFAIPALAAYMKEMKDATLLVSKNGESVDDLLVHLDDDRAYLISFLGLNNKVNPLSEYFL